MICPPLPDADADASNSSFRRQRSGPLVLLLTLSLLVACLTGGSASAASFDTVVIDAGHGGHDRGASIGYVFEKHLALDTARRVEQLLRKQGLKVVMTRSTDVFIPLGGRSAAGNRDDKAVFVSIHYNYNKSGSGHGLETFYCHDRSYLLAGYIQAYLIQETRLQSRGVKHANFHVIRATTRNPAVLVECGFVSNSAERAGMVTGLYRERLAVGIVKGILAFRQSK